MCVPECRYVHVTGSKGQKRVSGPLEQELQITVSLLMWVLGTVPGSSARQYMSLPLSRPFSLQTSLHIGTLYLLSRTYFQALAEMPSSLGLQPDDSHAILVFSVTSIICFFVPLFMVCLLVCILFLLETWFLYIALAALELTTYPRLAWTF